MDIIIYFILGLHVQSICLVINGFILKSIVTFDHLTGITTFNFYV